MSSLRQIEANRRNSQLSTGPRTLEGKVVSRFNALKSGINAKSQVIPGEDPAEMESLTAEYHNQFQPTTALARFLVDNLVSADWQLRRLRRVEAELWAHQISTKERFGSLDEKAPLGNVFDYNRDSFSRLPRRIDSAERSYYRALTQLQRLRSETDGENSPAGGLEPECPPAQEITNPIPGAECEPGCEPALQAADPLSSEFNRPDGQSRPATPYLDLPAESLTLNAR